MIGYTGGAVGCVVGRSLRKRAVGTGAPTQLRIDA
jgi:hypothetical protein